MANKLDCDIMKVSSNSRHIIMFIFRFKPFWKLWIIVSSSYELNSTTTVFL